jgi:hypothetical protein
VNIRDIRTFAVMPNRVAPSLGQCA